MNICTQVADCFPCRPYPYFVWLGVEERKNWLCNPQAMQRFLEKVDLNALGRSVQALAFFGHSKRLVDFV